MVGLPIVLWAPTELSKFIEPLFFGSILIHLVRSKQVVSLLFFLALGQLLISLSNSQLIGFIALGMSGGMYDYIIPAYIQEAIQLRYVGSLSFVYGYIIMKDAKKERIRSEIRSIPRLFYWAVAVMIVIHLTPFRLPGTFNAVFEWLPYGILFMLSRNAFEKEDTITHIYAILLVCTMFVLAFLFATLRTEMVLPFLFYGLGALKAKGNLRYFIHPRFTPLYLFGFVFITFFTAFGNIRGNSYGAERLTLLQEQKEVLDEQIEAEPRGPFQRLADIAQISNVVDLRVNQKVQKGETLLVLATALIPRFLWPDKPPIFLGVWFALAIDKALPTEDGWYNTSINMTVPGHLWLELGWTGLIGGMFLAGIGFRFMWRLCGELRSTKNILAATLGTYLMFLATAGIGADLQIFVTLLALVLIFLFLSFTIRFVKN